MSKMVFILNWHKAGRNRRWQVSGGSILLGVFFALAAVRTWGATAMIDVSKTGQTIEGLGGATAFYAGWIKDHPYKQEIYTNAFAGLNLSMLRLGNWFRYTNSLDYAAYDIVSNANRVLGHAVPVYMSSWAPPAFLKSNGQVGNGGTLAQTNGAFAYADFANYWYDSLQAYRSNGVAPTWISIQNEPDWAASYDSCVFHPTEDTVKGTNYASYAKALDATFQRLTQLTLPPKILAPEVVGLGYNAVQNFAATMNSNSFYGVAHHLYGGSTDGTPDGYRITMLALTNVFPAKPKFMTEFGYTNMIPAACLIHDCLTVEQAVAFNFWSLIWPASGAGLVQIENPYNVGSWTNAPTGTATQAHGWWLSPAYWAMKHFSYFINPGCRRVEAVDNDANVRVSAYLSADNLRLVVVLINTNASASSAMTLNCVGFAPGQSRVYQTAGTNFFQPLGGLTNAQALPPLSLTTVVLDQWVNVGQAANPSPANGAGGLALATELNWTGGSNARAHAVYLGLNSNAVARATPAAPEYQGTTVTNRFRVSMVSGATYFWRVDELAGINTNRGVVWSFGTVAPSASFTLKASDNLGASSFNAIGNWVTNGTMNSAAAPPDPAGTYDTANCTLRTPETGSAVIFGGGSLKLSAGAPVAKGSLLLKGSGGNTVTVNQLILSGGILAHGMNSGVGGIQWVAGNCQVVSNSTVSGTGTPERYIGLAANLSGAASLSNDCHVIYSGQNTGFSGQLIVGSGGVLEAGEAVNLGGPGASLVLDHGTLTPQASLTLDQPGGLVAINPGGGTWQVSSGRVLTVANPITGSGDLMCLGGGEVRLAGTNTATGSFVANGITLTLLEHAALPQVQLVVSNGAVLNIAALTVPLAVGSITFGGTLMVSNAGMALAYGDTLTLFNAAHYSGAFDRIVPAVPGSGLQWNTNRLAVDGTLFVTANDPALITPPQITRCSWLGDRLVIAGTNGNAPGTWFYTLAADRLALPLNNWTLVASNQFGAGGGFCITNTIGSTKPQQFFMLRLP